MNRVAVYPGTFDPPTNGHLDIIARAAGLFDAVYVAVSNHGRKNCLFSEAERCEALGKAVSARGLANVQVGVFSNMLADCAAEYGARYIIRGLRINSDFDYEFQMAQFVHDQNPQLEMVYLMAHAATLHISSSGVKEIAALGGNIDQYLPANVQQMMRNKYADRS